MLEIKECVNSYMNYQISEKKSIERTLKKYKMCINEMIDIMNINTIEDLNELNWVDMREQWIMVKENEGLSASSLNLRISAVRSFLAYLEGKRIIKENVAIRLKKFKTQAREVEVDLEKINKMLSLVEYDFNTNPCFKTARDRYLVNMFLFIGARNEECRNLKLDSININGKFELTGKFGKSRFVCLPDKLLKMHFDYLMKWRNEVPYNCDYLFVSVRGNKLDKNVPLDVVRKYAKLAGMENDFRCHDMRHLCITTLIESGVDISEVSKIVGHSNINTTQRNYFKPSENKVKENINKNILLSEVM
ncbi:tyrosine-type recombinase/integrase [Terrisporobacter sp.]|uniref:tyrosine-type recombinase/integrase n=1 Tax=Terrisporobacter sp. TaxID=1965305 RepID=UPI002897A4BC|nr:tyrosine-type recombinase/integrase [Terrisporobacter sp.]